jgi:hypothetical protein
MVAGRTVSMLMMRWAKRNAIWFVATIICFGLAFAEFRYGNPSLKEVLGWVGTVGATFVGAALAFAFNAIRSANDREEKECVAGNLALITLVEFLDRLLQYDRSYIQSARGRPDAWFGMRPGKLIDIEFKIDKNSLAFLLTKHSMTWRAIVLEETRSSVLVELCCNLYSNGRRARIGDVALGNATAVTHVWSACHQRPQQVAALAHMAENRCLVPALEATARRRPYPGDDGHIVVALDSPMPAINL